VSVSVLCRHDRAVLAKSANIWLSGRHVADMLATFSAKVVAIVINVAVVIVVVIVVIVVIVVLVAGVTPLASRRWARRVAAAPVAALAECTKEADLLSVEICLCLHELLCLLHLDDEDGVALAVPPSACVDVDVVDLVVMLCAW